MRALLTVSVPVADLRKEPARPSGGYIHDDLRETQLLCNELLLYVGEEGEWFRVEALEQPKYEKGRGWTGYPGWVYKGDVGQVTEKDDLNGMVKVRTAEVFRCPFPQAQSILSLPLATRLTIIGEDGKFLAVKLMNGLSGWVAKKSIQESGRSRTSDIRGSVSLFLGTPYLWGGRSIFLENFTGTVTGVDCSGLTHLAYRLRGTDIPRNAHDQWLATEPVATGMLEPGDLVFVSRDDDFDVITHVMFSLGGEQFIEAAETNSAVKKATFRKKFGMTLTQLREQDFVAGERKVYFGRPTAQKEFRTVSNEYFNSSFDIRHSKFH